MCKQYSADKVVKMLVANKNSFRAFSGYYCI